MEERNQSAAVNTPYQEELKIELTKLDTTDAAYAHATRLLSEEMKRVQSGDKYKSVSTIQLHHDRPSSNAVKVVIPVKEFPKFNFVGKLLGPKGNTLRGLQEATACKLSILGRGSMRDRNKEEELRKEGGKYAHLNEDLHVMIECFAEPVDAYSRIAHAIMEIKKFMVPDMQDDISMQQMQEMRYLNGQEDQGAGSGPPQRGRGRGAPPQRGAPPGMGGPPQRGFPPSRGAPRGGAPRGGPPTRGAPPSHAAPSPRGAMSDRGAPRGRGGPPMRGSPMGRGAPPSRGGPSPRGSMLSRGGYTPRGGRGASTVSQQPMDSYDYGHGASSQSYEEAPMATDSYDAGYSNPGNQYEDSYAEPAPARDTQYFDYGHGDSRQSYDDYGSSSASYDDRSAMKAPPIRGARGQPRSHPYEQQPRMLPRRGGY